MWSRKPAIAASAPSAPRSFVPVQPAIPMIFGPGRNWHRLTISRNSASLSQPRCSTAMRRAQTIPPPKPNTDTVKNALAMAPSGARAGCCSGRAADGSGVLMPVVQVGIMRVLVDETAMLVRMAVRFAVWIGRPMRVLMMLVVNMPMLVKERFVHMLVLVLFGKMQIHARRHERGSRD